MIILCNGMIRSGSTLQYNVVKDILINASREYELIGFFNKQDISNNIQDLLKKAKEDKIYLMKSHDYSQLNETEGVFVIYSFRNLMDVAGSQKRKFGNTDDALITTINLCIDNYNKILSSKKLLIQKYELLLDNLDQSVKEIFKFLNLEIDKKVLVEIIINNTPQNVFKKQNKNKTVKKFKNFISKNFLPLNENVKNALIFMLGKKRAERIRAKLTPHDNTTLFHLDHISSNFGKNGNWMEVLNEKEINIIMTSHSDWLKKNNYL